MNQQRPGVFPAAVFFQFPTTFWLNRPGSIVLAQATADGCSHDGDCFSFPTTTYCGGKWPSILSTAFASFFSFLSGLSGWPESVSLDVPRQMSCKIHVMVVSVFTSCASAAAEISSTDRSAENEMRS
jgi:hypothetical protein